MLGRPIETDPQSNAQIHLLSEDDRPSDNIYGEQPYGDHTGRWIAIRHHSTNARTGGISITDLADGTRRDVFAGDPRFPAFHAWGEYLYYQQAVDGKLMLRRCRYDTTEVEDISVLPSEMGTFSYGTVSPDHRYYAVCVMENTVGPSKVHLLCIQTGQWRLLLDKPGYHAKHEQFSRDGMNHVLIQLNHQPHAEQVLLGELTIDGEERLFPADQPHTARPTGHETWIGTSDRILFSSRDPEKRGNMWSARVKDDRPVPVRCQAKQYCHVSVSHCGRYWIGDVISEEGIPIYIGRFGSGTCRRLALSHTVHDGKQWSHTHPYLTADNKWLIFNSNRNGHAQVFGAALSPGWIEEL